MRVGLESAFARAICAEVRMVGNPFTMDTPLAASATCNGSDINPNVVVVVVLVAGTTGLLGAVFGLPITTLPPAV